MRFGKCEGVRNTSAWEWAGPSGIVLIYVDGNAAANIGPHDSGASKRCGNVAIRVVPSQMHRCIGNARQENIDHAA
jgi:hypothetical protein